VSGLQYWPASYYEMRHYALVLQLIELGLVTAMEEQRGRAEVPPRPVKRVATAEMIPAILAAGGPADRPSNRPQGFAVGDKVRTLNIPRFQCPWPRRGSAVALHRALHGPGAVGQGDARQRFDRPVGALS